VKGECKRGEECPFRHDKPTDPDDPLSDQNMRDRYYGTNDPVADKLLNRAKAMPVLRPPEDKTITTLYIGGLGEEGAIAEDDLHGYFYQFGEIRNMTMLPHKGCAFIQYTTRQSAEMAADRSFNKLTLKNRKITIRWGRPQSQTASIVTDKSMDPVPGLPEALPMPDFFGLDNSGSGPAAKRYRSDAPSFQNFPTSSGRPPALVVPQIPYINPTPLPLPPVPPNTVGRKIYYPSQDPQRLGAKGDVIE